MDLNKYTTVLFSYTFFIDDTNREQIIKVLKEAKDGTEFVLHSSRFNKTYFSNSKKIMSKLQFKFIQPSISKKIGENEHTYANHTTVNEYYNEPGLIITIPLSSREYKEILAAFEQKRNDLFYSITKQNIEFI